MAGGCVGARRRSHTRAQGAATSEAPPAIAPAPQETFGFEDEVKEPAPIEAGGPKSALDEQLGEMMGDAPMCDKCGHITVRNGACYKCLNCGNSLGCS